jgi:hypothetical protein
MVERTVKVKLGEITTFFARFTHCGVVQLTMKEELMECHEINCCKCDEPVMLRSSNGLWYYLSERVFP